jgi:hypothetical protein
MMGTIPFKQSANTAVMFKVVKGVRPERPTNADVLGLTDAVWSLMDACWHQEWNKRPPVSTVLSRLNEASDCWNPASLTTTSVEKDSDDSDASSAISGAPHFF